MAGKKNGLGRGLDAFFQTEHLLSKNLPERQ